jgi:hypothetical protein
VGVGAKGEEFRLERIPPPAKQRVVEHLTFLFDAKGNHF